VLFYQPESKSPEIRTAEICTAEICTASKGASQFQSLLLVG